MIASAATTNVMGPCVLWTHARLNRFVPTVVSYVVRCSPARGLHHLPRPAPVRIHANGPRVGVEGVVPTRSVSHPRPCRVTSCLCHAGSRPRVLTVNCRALAAAGALAAGVVIAGCGSGSSSPGTTPPPASSAPPASPATTIAPSAPTTAAATTSAATCPSLAQANAALGASYRGPTSTPTAGGRLVCLYTGSAGNAGSRSSRTSPQRCLPGRSRTLPGHLRCPASRPWATERSE